MQGSVDLCASVALVDECGHVLLDTVVKPSIPVTNYRTASTGLTAADVNQGMPFRKARKLLMGFLRAPHGSPPRLQCHAGKSVVLVGVHLQHALACLLLDLHLPPDCLRSGYASIASQSSPPLRCRVSCFCVCTAPRFSVCLHPHSLRGTLKAMRDVSWE